MAFTHLHVHTEYSLLDGSNKIKEYVKRVKELGMTSAAITDHGNMYGAIDFYEEARANGINPVLGCEVYVAPGSRLEREPGSSEERYHHLVLLAENNQGYENLMKIVSKGYTEGFYYRPRVDFEVLEKYHEGIIALSACLAGEVPRYIEKGMMEEARNCARKYESCFGKGNYYLELQDHGIPEQRKVNTELLLMSKELGIPLVATNDVHYTYAEDADAHDILLCVQTGKKLADEDRMRYEGGQYYVKSEEEMTCLFPYAVEAIENTQKIADRCHVEIVFGETKLPHYDVPEGYDSWTYLNHLCMEGLKVRYPEDYQQHRQRLEYELDTIRTMGFVDYFLIVWDFINYAKSHGIAVGPGRGSAAGSIVAYSLKITDIDPIRYNLLFERFLNPERVSMPDIDIDFCFERRQEVIDYVGRKYGSEKVVQIVTFGRMLAKGVIRDVGRVMDIPYTVCDEIAKMIPGELGITIEKALEMNPKMRERYEEDLTVRTLIDMSMRLEGLPRQTGMHAAGVLICPEAADEFVPLSRGADGSITTQYTMTTLERLGLLKMDFLGLRTLTVIQNAIRNIQETTGKTLDMQKIDYNDKAVLSSLCTGKTDGVFQLESGGMKEFMKELRPSSLEDVIAGISLYRPGPMDFIPKYIAGKNDPEHITYACKELEPILEPTYGCIVYQEQVMQIVRDLAGYTMGRSDNVRRAMSKKKQSVMEKEREIFIGGNEDERRQAMVEAAEKGLVQGKAFPEDALQWTAEEEKEAKIPALVEGCVRRGISKEVANGIYDTMMDFAKYAFNKSHAACYAVVAYQTACLKYYHPVEFMAALMTSVIDNAGKVAEYILVCRNMGIELMAPDINEGEAGFSVSDGRIRYALTAIKNVGRNVIDAVVAERRARGKFLDLKDFVIRVGESDVNKRAMENFIKSGAFDCFGATRKQLMYVYAIVMDNVHSDRKTSMAGQMTLFDLAADEDKGSFAVTYPEGVGEYSKDMILAFEKEVLGVYVSGHPLDAYRKLWDRVIKAKTTDFILETESDDAPGGERKMEQTARVKDHELVTVGGMIQEKKITYTKRGEPMAFVTLEDLVGSVEVIVFPKTYRKYENLLVEDAKVLMKGRVSAEENKDAKLLCDEIMPFSSIRKTLWLQLDSKEDYEKRYQEVFRLLKESDGKDRVMLYFKDAKEKLELPANRSVDAGEELMGALTPLLGAENIRITF